jgi:hypothetical protein
MIGLLAMAAAVGPQLDYDVAALGAAAPVAAAYRAAALSVAIAGPRRDPHAVTPEPVRPGLMTDIFISGGQGLRLSLGWQPWRALHLAGLVRRPTYSTFAPMLTLGWSRTIHPGVAVSLEGGSVLEHGLTAETLLQSNSWSRFGAVAEAALAIRL